MTHQETVLLLSRGMRTHHLFREMAATLAKEYQVAILAAPEEFDSFSLLDNVVVDIYETEEVPGVVKTSPALPLIELRTRAREIEQTLGLPLYKSACNFLVYGRMVKQFGGQWHYLKTERQVLETYVGAYSKLSSIFDRSAPHIVFYETIDLPSSYIAFALALQKGIFAVDLRISPLSNNDVSVGFGIYRKNIVLEYLYSHREHIRASSYDRVDKILNRPSEHLYGTAYAQLNQYRLRGNSIFNIDKIYDSVRSIERARTGLGNYRWHLKEARNRLWLSRHLTNEIPDEPYLLFFLPHLPEATTCTQASRWAYPEGIIAQLAVNAPANLRILVKEHPNTFGRRGRNFFKPLLDMPNVILGNADMDNFALVSRSAAIIATTGTAGLEGIVLGKRVGVLGRPYYSVYKGVSELDFPEDIYPAMADASLAPALLEQERRHFLAAYVQSLHPFGHGEGNNVYPTTGGHLWGFALKKTLQFIREHKLIPSHFENGLH